MDSPNEHRDTQREYLRRMLLIRCVEERIAAHYAEQKMRCPTHLSTGQETVGAAVGVALHPDDQVVSTHRSHAHYLGKGGNLDAMVAEIYGKATGCSAGKGGSMHLVDLSAGFLGSTAIVGNTIPVGVGAALANQLLGNHRISAVFLGDASVEEGVFHEAANFAVTRGLPVLFVCENNLYSVYSPLDVRQPPDRKIADFAAAYGMPSESGDGYDAGQVLSMVSNAANGVRRTGTPCFLEFATYRWREHCGPDYDNQLGYRTEAEFAKWNQRDPVADYSERMIAEGNITRSDLETLNATIDRDVCSAFARAEAAPFPDASELHSHLYANDH